MRHSRLAFALSAFFSANAAQTFTGTITDSMCLMNHKMMTTTPDSKCVQECVRSKSSKYVLYDGKIAYKLSDQQTPAQFAAKRVRVTGTLYPKTGVIQVEKIDPVK
jgi:hypothetical protein